MRSWANQSEVCRIALPKYILPANVQVVGEIVLEFLQIRADARSHRQ